MNPPSCGPVGGDLLPLQKQKLGGRLCPRSACCRHKDPGWNDSARGSSLFLGVPQVLCLGSVPWLLPPSWPQGARGGASWRKSRSACPLPLRTGPPALKAAAHQLCAGIAQGLPWGRTSGAGGGAAPTFALHPLPSPPMPRSPEAQAAGRGLNPQEAERLWPEDPWQSAHVQRESQELWGHSAPPARPLLGTTTSWAPGDIVLALGQRGRFQGADSTRQGRTRHLHLNFLPSL